MASRALIHKLKSKLGSISVLDHHNFFNSTKIFHFNPISTPQILPNPVFISSKYFESTKAQKQFDSAYSDDDQALDFPGGKVGITSQMKFISETNGSRVECYRVLGDDGQLLKEPIQVTEQLAVKMYEYMATLQVMDTIFYEAQRQGRISFYLTTIGEEAINIASAAALSIDDVIFPQYREPGILLWRGFTLQEFANQCFGNKADYGKGRQMPIHYGSNKLNYITVASTVATQLLHAVGAAYSLKMDNKNACTITYFGDGGTSTGDFHAALNFAAVLEAPVIFFCRNNGDGIVVRGQAYGIQSIRVDGNDALAIYNAVSEARRMAALTYRAGHHSTSDDSTKYRPVEEMEFWKHTRDPVLRFRKWIDGNGWWNDQRESELRSSVRKQLMNAIQVAEKLEKPPVADLFTDVYDVVPPNLQEQERLLRETITKHQKDYPTNVPV
ncbi:2-oxoisovalerate dehydrogenase subunit alpha 1 mitochondrial [Bienertia sinuspersici]